MEWLSQQANAYIEIIKIAMIVTEYKLINAIVVAKLYTLVS